MIMTKPQARARHFDKLASLDAYDIARRYDCRYHGDVNPIEYGGVFFDDSEWGSANIARAVEFSYDEDGDVLRVWRGVIHRPDRDTQWRLWRESGVPIDEYGIANAIVDSFHEYGVETPSCRFPDVLTFKLDDWKPGRIWKSLHPWLAELLRS